MPTYAPIKWAADMSYMRGSNFNLNLQLMKRLIVCSIAALLLFALAASHTVAQELTNENVARFIKSEVINELGVVTGEYEEALEDGDTAYVVEFETDYVSGYAFRSQFNSFVDQYSDVEIINAWHVNRHDELTLTFRLGDPTFVVLTRFSEEEELAELVVSRVNQP